MKRYILLAGSLLAAFLLVILLLGTTGQVLAEDIPPEDRDAVIEVVPVQEEAAAAEQEAGVVTQVVPVGGEGNQPLEPGTIQVVVSLDKTADLPVEPPEARGVLLDQSSGSLWVGKSATSLVGGERTCAAPGEVDQLEITLTDNTRFIEDATDFAQARATDDPAVLHVQQVMRLVPEPGELPRCASLLVWGERQSGQLVADVILFHDELR